MYTDGFDELSEAENRSPRTYVSTGAQDIGKLQRENDRLKKSLEKEQFFNRLLDQELKEIKGSQNGASTYNPEQFAARAGVSKTAFNILLVITIALAAFAAYTVYFNKQYNLFTNRPPLAVTLPESSIASPIKDSVPNIIADKKDLPAFKESSAPAVQQKTTPPPVTQNKAESKAKPKVTHIERPADATDELADNDAAADPAPVASTPVVAERPVIGTYIVSSKANFYSGPDENTMRSYFIAPGVGTDKLVNALEDKNGFIYVEFKNDVGYITKGWLSKADLTVK